ncbi:uncharacterized protein BX663DRAFT_499187 [Cokeromyces recurvatus]|uniref:uncharacterized protein n=1 Tax=Cokeromyces recurvatus TaxID=90255 RepID=UPI0022205697|nr:uncharacterized protein BX663DRAFT_499187 [Cokeromyces recurvatus]KAI7906195.1 hypothetical protein BX663DRAFT_499187 [Cokeromyces recurvatus]
MRKSTTLVSRLINTIIDNGKNFFVCRREVLLYHQLTTIHQKRSIMISNSRSHSSSAAIIENTKPRSLRHYDSFSLFNLSNRVTLADLDFAIQSRNADRAWSIFVTLTTRGADSIPLSLCCSLYALLEFAKSLATTTSTTNKLRQRQLDQLLNYVLQHQSKDIFLASVTDIPLTYHKLLLKAIRTRDQKMAWITFYRFHKDSSEKLPRNMCLKLMLLMMKNKRLDKNQLKMRLQLIALHGAGTSEFDSRYLSAADLTRLAHICHGYQKDKRTAHVLINEFVDGLSKKKLGNRADALDELIWHIICQGDIEKAHEVLDRVQRTLSDKVNVNEMVFVNMMNAYRRQKKYHEALKIFERFLETGQPVTVRAYNTVLQLFAEQGLVDKAYFLFNTMERLDVEPDIATYTEMIRVNAYVGNMKMCIHFYNKILQHEHLNPNVYVYSALIEASSRLNDLKSVFHWFQQMLKDKIEPNEVIISIILKALAHQPDPNMPDTILRIAHQAFMSGIKTDSILYTILLKMQAESIGIEGALKVHRDMLTQSVKPSTYTYTILINTFSKHKRPDISERIFELMKKSHDLKPNTATYSVMMDAWLKINKTEKVESLVFDFLKECKSDKTGRLWLDTSICDRIKWSTKCC